MQEYTIIYMYISLFIRTNYLTFPSFLHTLAVLDSNLRFTSSSPQDTDSDDKSTLSSSGSSTSSSYSNRERERDVVTVRMLNNSVYYPSLEVRVQDMVLSGSERETFLQSYVYKLINTYNSNNNNNNNTRNDTSISDVTAGNPTRFTDDSSSGGGGVGFTGDIISGDSGGRKWNFLGSDTPDTKAGTSGMKRPPGVTVYYSSILYCHTYLHTTPS